MTNITTIRLYSTVPGQTPQLFNTLSIGELELNAKTNVPLNFAVADIRDIAKKKGTFSKSITIPGTKNNHQLLNNYYDVNIQAGTFNIDKLQKCAIVQNGIIILDNALLQLVSINKDQKNSTYEENVTYTLLVKDQTSDFFTAISNKMLEDLDFSNLDHLYTAENVISSYDNTVDDGFKYVMPYNSPDLDTIGADATFNLIEFAPAIYVKKYFDKIFTNTGYTYNWVGMDDAETRFSKLLIPYNGDVVLTEQTESEIYTASANRTTVMTTPTVMTTTTAAFYPYPVLNTIGSSMNTLVTFPFETNDPNNNYSTSTSIYTTPNIPSVTNDIKYEVTLTYEIIIDNPYATAVYLQNQQPTVAIGPTYPIIYRNMNLTSPIANVKLFNGDVPVATMNLLQSSGLNTKFPSTATAYSPGTTVILADQTTTFTLEQFGLIPGKILSLKTNIELSNVMRGQTYRFWDKPTALSPANTLTPKDNASIKLRIKAGNIKITSVLDGEVSYNVPLKMNKFIPKQIKQSDFVKSILTMFNLLVEVDRDNSNQLNITSRDKYYDDGKVEDWTKKLAKDKQQELKFVPEITNKKSILTYKQDEDWANVKYFNTTNEVYGQLEYVFANEYVKDTKTTEIMFSPTPVANTSFGAVCPIWNGQAPQNNIRILYDGGNIACMNYNIVNYYDPTTGATSSIVTPSYYPHISHWDSPVNPTFDLNFGVCDFYFRTGTYNYTNNTLFNLHWRRTFNQMNNGKLLSAHFYLNEYDIFKMRLSDKIRIDNSWWNINKIMDYDANSSGPTKVELLSIDEDLQIPFSERNANRINQASPLLGVLNDLAKSKQRYLNTILSTGDVNVVGRGNLIGEKVTGTIIGNDNNISTNKAFIIGNNNNIESDKVFIIGDDNVVTPDIIDSLIIGSGVTATQSSTLYATNIIVEGTINNQPVTNVVGLWEAGAGVGAIQTPGNSALAPTSLAGGSGNSNTLGGAAESIAWGNNAQAAGLYSAAFGLDTVADGYSIATGDGCSTGVYSAAFGSFTTAGDYSIVAGDSCSATSNGVAFGSDAISTSNGAVAMGLNVDALNTAALSTGYQNVSNGMYSTTGGNQNTANSLSETVIGQFSELVTGSSTTFVATDTVFRIGIGTAVGSRLDAFRVYKNSAIKLNPVTTASIGSPVVGMIIYNTTLNTLSLYNGSSWTNTNGTPIIKVYKAIINMNTGVATVLYTSLGITPTWSTGVVGGGGSFTIQTTGTVGSATFTTNKTVVKYTIIDSVGSDTYNSDLLKLTSTTQIDIIMQTTGDYTSTGSLYVEIEIYP